jgi:hypothetical protein
MRSVSKVADAGVWRRIQARDVDAVQAKSNEEAGIVSEQER